MRIALVIETMDPARGGRETSTAQIAEGLARRGCDVTVLCQRSRWSGQDVGVRELRRRGLLRPRQLSNFVADVQQEIAGGAYDVVHATLPVPGANVYQPRGGTIPAQLAGRIRQWGLLGSLRGAVLAPLNFHRRRLTQLERRLVANQTTRCLAVSQMVAEEFAQFYNRRNGVKTIYNGVEIPQISPVDRADWRQKLRLKLGIGQDETVFLCVARNFPLKGVGETIRAFAKWHGQRYGSLNARLVVVGRDMVEGYQRVAALRGVGKQIVFLPPTREIFQWYAAADACILLSWYDPCSRTVLEATRMGIPSITTVYNGAAEILAEGAGIVVASPKDTRAIMAALDELADPQRRASRSETCLGIADQLSMERHVDALLSVYAEATKRP